MLTTLWIILALGILVAVFWTRIPFISETAHTIFDPTLGRMLDYNINLGMVLITAVISLIITLFQKYMTDQTELRRLKAEQKQASEAMKEYKNHPEKMMEFTKKQMEFTGAIMKHTMRPLLFTTVPIIFFFRWFGDYFANHDVAIFGFMSWFWAYFVLMIIWSIVFRKLFKVA